MGRKVGILHPGQMGISVAATIKNSGNEIYWLSDGRSQATRTRAESQGMVELQDLKTMCRYCDVIVSVCPPHAAVTVAESVVKEKYQGFYLDANAISPQRVIRIDSLMSESGVCFVDGGIIGGPAWNPGKTWMYLSGKEAQDLFPLFSAGPLETEVIGTEIGKASALKMCFAAYTKGSTALLCAILATSEGLGVRENLEKQWSRDGSDFTSQAHRRAQRVTQKAWRFEGEMREIANTFASVGLPEGFHQAAAEVYGRMAQFKGQDPIPGLDSVLKALILED